MARGTTRVYGHTWAQTDYRDRLYLTSRLATKLGKPANAEEEERQCLVLNTAGMILLAETGVEPALEDVVALKDAMALPRSATVGSSSVGVARA